MYDTYKKLDLCFINEKYLSIDDYSSQLERKLKAICYDGPPSVSGLPGIHHILSRTLKDIFCRYKILKGYQVINRTGWDTHGLPIELGIEKKLGITKKDIGVNISVEDYNNACRESIYQYILKWEEITKQHGYCTDIKHPYITCDVEFMESEWWAFKRLYEKGYIYQDYSVQPYSPAAGTGLSSHELNQPGCYKVVKDLAITVMFRVLDSENTYFISWTTTPWTLPANSALAVNKNINYVKIQCKNKYSNMDINVILAQEALQRYFKSTDEYVIMKKYKGEDLIGIKYQQLFPFVKPEIGDCYLNGIKKKMRAFEVISADYVTTTDGTGIVHISPSFGSDDRKVANEACISEIVVERDGVKKPIVDEQGKYVDEIIPWRGCYVKKEYYSSDENAVNVDLEIIKYLKQQNMCFYAEKYEHNYPHCWRTDKPLLYYPLKSWFIKTTAVKDKLIELNNSIHWHHESIGIGRFKNWLENIVDWNVSRNRFWGTAIPIWMTKDCKEIKVIGSIEELLQEHQKACEILKVKNKFSYIGDKEKYNNNYHIPDIDSYVMLSSSGEIMHRVPEVLDVWFDSGCMPFAQYHYPFENEKYFKLCFPADFICEGIDQTRGWFFTLHVLSVMLFDNIAYKNVVANGLVLDKNGNKMSKRLGNTVDPFVLFKQYGADAVRWYMIINNDPCENLKFDIVGVEEVIRKFFMTLFNTYNFFALYYNANEEVLKNKVGYGCSNKCRVEKSVDLWLLSRLNSILHGVDEALNNYDVTKAIRLINDFTIEDLSNWYVRINRKRFSKNDNIDDQICVFNILYNCLCSLSIIIWPFTPFFAKWLMENLHIKISEEGNILYPKIKTEQINTDLECEMEKVKSIVSVILSLRKKSKIKVRQPLSRVVVSEDIIKNHKDLVDVLLSETNIKKIEIDNNLDGYEFTTQIYNISVALDIIITEDLRLEYLAREFVKNIQTYRKEKAFSVGEVIKIDFFTQNNDIITAVKKYKKNILKELLCKEIKLVDKNDVTDMYNFEEYYLRIEKI